VPINLTFEVSVENALIQRANNELLSLLLNQNISFDNRWYSGAVATCVIPIIRIIALIVSIAGLALSIFMWYMHPHNSQELIPLHISAIIFLIVGLIFFFQPQMQPRIRRWILSRTKRRCTRRASGLLSKARALTPFTIQYNIRDRHVACFQCKGGVWKLRWLRNIKGVAFQGLALTAVFSKPTSLYPRMLILHNDASQLKEALDTLGIPVNAIAEYSRDQ